MTSDGPRPHVSPGETVRSAPDGLPRNDGRIMAGPVRAPGRSRSAPGKPRGWWPDASTPRGAVLYAVLGGLIVWLLVDVLPHIHIHITIAWH